MKFQVQQWRDLLGKLLHTAIQSEIKSHGSAVSVTDWALLFCKSLEDLFLSFFLLSSFWQLKGLSPSIFYSYIYSVKYKTNWGRNELKCITITFGSYKIDTGYSWYKDDNLFNLSLYSNFTVEDKIQCFIIIIIWSLFWFLILHECIVVYSEGVQFQDYFFTLSVVLYWPPHH